MSEWQPIETAPRDRLLDLWAKTWDAATDTFQYDRFPDCEWIRGLTALGPSPHWGRLPDGGEQRTGWSRWLAPPPPLLQRDTTHDH